MAGLNDVVIIAGCRTAIGKLQGSLSDMVAPQLGGVAVREAGTRANLQAQQVDECIMGNVVSAGLGQNPARQAALFGGLAPEAGAMTINNVCGSGLKAVALAAQAIDGLWNIYNDYHMGLTGENIANPPLGPAPMPPPAA